jgi:two-component system cell cycle response regulator DivK
VLDQGSPPPARALDGGLAERLRRRDPEALGVLFDRFAPNVYALLAPVEADAARLDQLVEDVFWETWLSAGRAGGDGDVQRIMLQAVSSRLRGRTPLSGRQENAAMGMTILLVEDNADNQEIYRLILTHHGFAVLQAWDGECGVRMARHHSPDLILMDLTMPLIDGLEATRMLKADPATSRIPIIALTAHAEHEDRAAAEEAGCVSFLSKPAAPNEVAGEVRRVLGLREMAVP